MSKFNDSEPCACDKKPASNLSSGSYGEEQTLEAMEKFRKFYEDKLRQIDMDGGGDCTELKLKLQERWIKDLTEQTEMMARVVKELEEEATTRVRMLEDKLKQTSKAAYELKKDTDGKNSEEVENLEQRLKDAEAKIARMRPCVHTKTTCTTMDDLLEAKEKDLEKEITRREREVEDLQNKIKDLENTLNNSQARSENLQKADSKNSAKTELKKLRQQKRCYEHVLGCFKQEMGVMSEQLVNLQELLKLSNESCKEENGQLYKAIADLAQVCERLKAELKDSEKKIFKENQQNQLKDMKIDELLSTIDKKNAELDKHDMAINEMKKHLENVYLENHQLQSVIAGLNGRIMQLELCGSLEAKSEKSKSKLVENDKSVEDLQATLDRKDRKLSKLEKDFKAQHDVLKMLQTEFEKVREKNKEKVKSLKRQNEDLKIKLEKAEENNQKMVEELSQVRENTSKMITKDSNRDQELLHSRQIILELRQTLIELNESLAESELHQMALSDECRKKIQTEESKHEGIFFNCRCEIALYRKLVENLKDILVKEKKRAVELEAHDKALHDELKHKEIKIIELQKKMARKEKESHQRIKDLTDQLKRSQEEEKKLREFINNLKNQLQERENEVLECQCLTNKNDMVTTQEEINMLKTEIKKMIENQVSLNSENDKLLQQICSFQNSYSILDEKNRYLKEKVERLQLENQKLKDMSISLQREKEQFTLTIRNLEAELTEVRTHWDEICAESKYVVDNVKEWLDEQRKINDKVKKKAQCYTDTISQLKMENQNLQNCTCPSSGFKCTKPCRPKFRSYSPPPQRNVDFSADPWSYDSQGNDTSRDSPSSFLTCSVEEWYSPNYRDETDFESDHEADFVQKLEAVAVEMRNNNKKWREKYNKQCECYY